MNENDEAALRVADIVLSTLRRHDYRTPVQVRADQCWLDPNETANLKLAA